MIEGTSTDFWYPRDRQTEPEIDRQTETHWEKKAEAGDSEDGFREQTWREWTEYRLDRWPHG